MNESPDQLTAAVIVSSNSAAAGRAQDTTGPVLAQWLSTRGFTVTGPTVVADGTPVGQALRRALEEKPRLIVTTGGTGLTPDDQTPEQTLPLLDRQLPGIMHALYQQGTQQTPHAVLSRGFAGAHGATLIVNLPGSAGGVKDGIAVLDPILDHALAQLADVRDHTPRAGADTNSHTDEVVPAGAPAQAPGPADPYVPAPEGVHTDVVTRPLDADAAMDAVQTETAGAVALFRGLIRNHDSGRAGVTGLDYTHHPDAAQILARIVAQVTAQYPGVRSWCEHRVGRLSVGEDAIVVAVASSHRAEAFACCAEITDEVKAKVPIWKQQFYETGDHNWVGINE